MPIGSRIRDPANQIVIEPLVDHSTISNAWMWNIGLIVRIGVLCFRNFSRVREMLEVDRTRKGIHVRVLTALCFVEALSASKDQIGYLHQFFFVVDEFFRSVFEE